jgi:hypothetical protein
MSVLSVLWTVVILRTAQADGTFSLNLILVLTVGLLIGILAVVLVVRNQQMPITKVLNGEARLQALVATLTADLTTNKEDLAAANRKIGALTAELGVVRLELADVKRMLAVYQGDRDNQTLLVGIGPDPDLEEDLIRIRGVRTRRGPIKIVRLSPLTAGGLANILQSSREVGRPIRWVHLATKATAKGVQMADGQCTGEWMSGEMTDVKVLVLAGCDTFAVGESLTGIPLVVTTLEKISHDDAKSLAGVFWQAVANELAPPDVETWCRERLPGRIMEMVNLRYWTV